jgi:dTDP-4-dehydrorhamnose reductase
MILVLGSNGQLGFELKRLLANDAIYLDRNDCDLSKKTDLQGIFDKYKFSTLINAAAYTQVDKAEDEQDLAFEINAVAPGYLAELCKEHGVKFIHFSTDYVFDGLSKVPYLEEQSIAPINYYGFTKAEGEKRILILNPEALIIRTSWVYSSHGNNFVKTMIKFGNSREELKVVNDQFGSPTWARELALVTLAAINKDLKGFYHFSQGGQCSWYEFALEIKKISGFSAKVMPIPTTEYPTRAKRPNYSLLSKEKIKKDLNLEIPDWKESLNKMIKEVL